MILEIDKPKCESGQSLRTIRPKIPIIIKEKLEGGKRANHINPKVQQPEPNSFGLQRSCPLGLVPESFYPIALPLPPSICH